MITNTHKHFVLMLLLGILAWAFAFLGKAQGLGWFPNIRIGVSMPKMLSQTLI
jgi:hypothetical protein